MEWTPLYLNADPTQPIRYTGMCQVVYGEKQAEMGRRGVWRELSFERDISWKEEPGRLQSTGSLRVGHD